MPSRVAIIGGCITAGVLALGGSVYEARHYLHQHRNDNSASAPSPLTVTPGATSPASPHSPDVLKGQQFIFIRVREFDRDGHDDPVAVARVEKDFLSANKGVKIDSIAPGWDGVYIVWECRYRCCK